MKILGINDGHNAAVCLMTDGEITCVIQEERVTAEKNKGGFPSLAVKLILDKSGLTIDDIDVVAMNGNYMPTPKNRHEELAYYHSLFKDSSTINMSLIKNKLKNIGFIAGPYEKRNKELRLRRLAKEGIDTSKVQFIDHHLLHASTAYYGNGNFDDDILVLTCDGAGDRVCATVNVGKKGKLTRIAEVHEKHSVATMYAAFTFLNGMVPLEHEYKIMGMAPFVHKQEAKKVADEFWKMFKFSEDGLKWDFTKGYSVFGAMSFFKEFMFLKRFDHLMGGLQLFNEEFLVKWVRACIKKTGIHKIALSGGIFMNVKANKVIMEMEEVESVFVFPSCGDESNAIGACYNIEAESTGTDQLKKLDNLYFGIAFSNEEIKQAFDSYRFELKYKITKMENIEAETAKLLSDGNVVARFKGREEFGARSLGNRAILANPSRPEVVKEINKLIKNRDFWMPFAASIIDTDIEKYVNMNPKNAPYYMVMTYDTHVAASDIAAGIHPYDKTVRPQKVTQETSPEYWELINEFRNITGIGGLLNTSLNLHGLPLVHKPEDAFHVMEKSSLKYLAIGDYLIEKTN